jgi:hypothetical protein
MSATITSLQHVLDPPLARTLEQFQCALPTLRRRIPVADRVVEPGDPAHQPRCKVRTVGEIRERVLRRIAQRVDDLQVLATILGLRRLEYALEQLHDLIRDNGLIGCLRFRGEGAIESSLGREQTARKREQDARYGCDQDAMPPDELRHSIDAARRPGLERLVSEVAPAVITQRRGARIPQREHLLRRLADDPLRLALQ